MSNLTVDELYNLIDPKSPELLKELGSASGLAIKLNSNLETGLKLDQLPRQQELYGTNQLPEAISKSFLQFVYEALQDKTLIILMVAAAAELAIGVYKTWFASKKDSIALIDGGAIFIAIMIVVQIGAVSDFRKQAQFRALSEYGKTLNLVKVIRNGEPVDVHSAEIVVGDIVNIQTGVIIPADGVLISGFDITCDESAMTGEPHAIDKDLTDEPFLLSGTNVVSGVGKMIVIGTGINSLNGRSMLALEVEAEDTPLQQKLNVLADAIAQFAFYLAISMILILGVSYFIVNAGISDGVKIFEDLTILLILAITVVVVAVPEGLPLAVTLSLAHATFQMLKDNNLVRHLSACETMGNATSICSDKTGTLTLNRMTVVRMMSMETKYERGVTNDFISEVTKGNEGLKKIFDLIALSLNINSTAEESRNKEGEMVLNGSITEIALLELLKSFGYSFQKDRAETKVLKIVPFSSDRKRMSCSVKLPRNEQLDVMLGLDHNPGEFREFLFVKGASEIVLKGCDKYINSEGKITTLTEAKRTFFLNLISEYADNALRTICCAIKPYSAGKSSILEDGGLDDFSQLTLVMIIGILDPLRDEVPAAVLKCQKAGVVVRMVTGDSAPTARAIARGCGILTADGIVMEGPEFRKLTQSQYDEILPKLQVLARSSPLDKQILVNNLKRLGETVAVTGDGTNDAPALAAADVGFSMGIAGTEVAKQASDIILMDDNFATLVKALIWGRCVFDAIRKFLQFQLTVNVSAVVITVVTSLHTTFTGRKRPESVLTAIQLLWVNLIMDTLAALALATDDPSDELLNRLPSKRTDSLINAKMFSQIIGQAIYQIIACLAVYFIAPLGDNTPIPDLEEIPPSGYYTATLVFNTFIFCQVFNEINSRSISSDLNVFRGILRNYIFLAVIFVTVAGQIIIIFFGGVVFRLDPDGLSGTGWGISIALGSGSLIVGLLIRLLPDFNLPSWLLGGSSENEISEPIIVEVENPKEKMVESAEQLGGSTGTIDNSLRKSSQELWLSAIRQTKMQVRVVKVFNGPASGNAEKRKSSVPKSLDSSTNLTGWQKLRLYVVTMGAFRKHRPDPAETLLIDPRRLQSARVKLARERSFGKNNPK